MIHVETFSFGKLVKNECTWSIKGGIGQILLQELILQADVMR